MKRLALFALVVTAGCATVPPTNVHQPMSARPSPRMEATGGNGAIYQAGVGRPLFEDRRARYVGDTITVKITESTTASTKSNNKLDKSNTATASVTGVVKLSPSLLNQVKPDDTLFVFARSTEGSRMPLAILRKRVKDLPIQFTLDDSTAMSPAGSLSKADRVVVGARISKTGNAMPEKGDLAGSSAPVAVGARDVAIVIKDIVKQ